MVKKQLDLKQKNNLRDQIDTFETSLFGEGEKLAVFQFQEEHYLKYVKIQIKKSLKKMEILRLNIKTLQGQIRNGVEVPKTMTDEEEKKEEPKEESEEESKEESEEESKEESEDKKE